VAWKRSVANSYIQPFTVQNHIVVFNAIALAY
jgi:hypothetical protein